MDKEKISNEDIAYRIDAEGLHYAIDGYYGEDTQYEDEVTHAIIFTIRNYAKALKKYLEKNTKYNN
jgi:hypothetical protein